MCAEEEGGHVERAACGPGRQACHFHHPPIHAGIGPRHPRRTVTHAVPTARAPRSPCRRARSLSAPSSPCLRAPTGPCPPRAPTTQRAAMRNHPFRRRLARRPAAGNFCRPGRSRRRRRMRRTPARLPRSRWTPRASRRAAPGLAAPRRTRPAPPSACRRPSGAATPTCHQGAHLPPVRQGLWQRRRQRRRQRLWQHLWQRLRKRLRKRLRQRRPPAASQGTSRTRVSHWRLAAWGSWWRQRGRS